MLFFGTDDLGRDILSRLIMGTRYTLGSALLVVFSVAIIGGALGIIAGLLKGIKARFVGHIFDAFIVTYSINCRCYFNINGTKFMECNVCYAISDFALFHSHYLSCYSKELEKDYVVMLKLEGISNQALLKALFYRILLLFIFKKWLVLL